LVRLGFDWIDVVVSDNHFSLSERVLPAYLAAYEVLHRTHLERVEQCKQSIARVTSQEEYADARCDLDDEEYRWQEQTQALATMALTLTASANKSFLDQLKRLFASTHPANSQYSGKSQLLKQITEYKARFGVNLENVRHFGTIREVELARHCCIHEDGHVSADYRGKTTQRLVGTHGYIDLTPAMLTSILSEIYEFAHALSVEMKKARDAQRKVEKGESPP
jgi:hypothetical protein